VLNHFCLGCARKLIVQFDIVVATGKHGSADVPTVACFIIWNSLTKPDAILTPY
jgi:hypothetical protein